MWPGPGRNVPPIACILAKTNALAKERVDELIKWVRDNLSIKHVIPMRTFQVLSLEAQQAYLDADVMSILRKDFNVDWNKTHMSALEALEALINVIKSNETMSIEMVLANESNKQWWPFAFFHG